MLWRYIENNSVSAGFGLATDEYLVDSFTSGQSEHSHILRLYTYKDHCAILGRFQDAELDINLPVCRKSDIEVNRRITGGGAIIMGQSQLGVAIVIPSNDPGNNRRFSTKGIFENYSRGIIEALSQLGIQSEFRPKNDVLVAGKKIAGLAACVQENGNALFHASILLDIDIGLMANVLRIPFEKISDKEIKELENRLTSIRKETKENTNIDCLKRCLRAGFENTFQANLQEVPLNNSEVSEIETLQRGKYSTDEWIYQKSYVSTEATTITKKTRAGLLNIHISILNNTVKDIIITGDFFSTTEFVSLLERNLRWKTIDKEIINKVIQDAWLSSLDSVSELEPEVLTDCILEAGNKT